MQLHPHVSSAHIPATHSDDEVGSALRGHAGRSASPNSRIAAMTLGSVSRGRPGAPGWRAIESLATRK